MGIRRPAARIVRLAVATTTGGRRLSQCAFTRRSAMTPIVAILVAIFSLANIAGLMYLLASLRRRPGETAGTGETTGHVWDEDLRELNNPLPRWWLWLFIL